MAHYPVAISVVPCYNHIHIQSICITYSIASLWTEKELLIIYYLKDIRGILEKYDFVFIDGDHDKGVFIDFENYKDRAKML